MKANKTHISLETAKLLKNCGVAATQYFTKYFHKDKTETLWEVLQPQILPDKYETSEFYPAFTWQEILWEHAGKFFGDKGVYGKKEKANEFYPKRILDILQQQKYDEADLYFRNKCILINKN